MGKQHVLGVSLIKSVICNMSLNQKNHQQAERKKKKKVECT